MDLIRVIARIWDVEVRLDIDGDLEEALSASSESLSTFSPVELCDFVLDEILPFIDFDKDAFISVAIQELIATATVIHETMSKNESGAKGFKRARDISKSMVDSWGNEDVVVLFQDIVEELRDYFECEDDSV